LIKLYVKEPESDTVANYVKGLAAPVPCSHLHELEIKNGLRLKKFRREAALRQIRASVQLIDHDLASGALQRPDLNWRDVYLKAGELSETYSGVLGCRSLDVLHIASALLIRSTAFLTYDERQRALAGRAGLEVVRV
jgi:predicted nucleic acid-binding protein